MNRIYSITLIIFLVIVNCAEKSENLVAWSPQEPKTGDRIQIIYNSQSNEANLVEVSQITLIGQFYFEDSDSVLIVPMKRVKHNWQIEIDPPKQTILISIKFEDDLNRTDDNHGRGWTIIVRDKDGNIMQNTHYYSGKIYRGVIRPEAFPYYKKAIEEFNHEIKAYPQNYKAWFDKWEAELNLSKENIFEISNKLDSLLAIDPQNVALLKLAFNTNWKILGNKDKAINYAEQLMSPSLKAHDLDVIDYTLIFLKYSDDLTGQIAALEKFVNAYPESHLIEDCYFRLANYYLRTNDNLKAKSAFEKLNQLAPAGIDNKLTLASMEINDKNYTRAEQLLEDARMYCTEEFMRIQNPWTHPGKRLNQLNFNLCQIYSTTATLNYTLGNFEEAIKNRQATIEFGTQFPAYEWIGIGKASLALKKLEQAEKAFLKALTINPYDNEAIQKLKAIYLEKNLPEADFNLYLEKAINAELLASATAAPDFEAIDMNDEKIKLSDMRGKIIVLTFWDSWSTACLRDIPQLNELVADFKNLNFVEFWAISGDHKSSLNRFLQDQAFDFHQFYNGSEIRKLYQVIGLPTHLVIDSNGLIRFKYIGFTPSIKRRLADNIQFLLKESKIIS